MFVKQWKEKEKLKKFLGTIIENFKLPKSKTVTNTELKNLIKEEVEIALEHSESSLRKTLEYVHLNIKRAEEEDDTFYFK